MRPEKPVATSLEILRVPGWDQGWLIHGFSSRTGGTSSAYRAEGQPLDLNLGFTASDTREAVLSNRRLLVEALVEGGTTRGLVTLKQVHSPTIWRVGPEDVDAVPREGDGMVTAEPGILLGIQTADCIPVLLVDPEKRAIGAVHAGWRGTLARIVEAGVNRMREEFGSDPASLMAAIGPGIGQCCYATGEEVREKFEAEFPYGSELFSEGSDSRAAHLDLAEANRRQLLAAGLQESAVYSTGECTGCQTERFFSHRMEQGFTGRMMSVIGIALA